MKFSIIIPVYNVENYIAKCLESVVNQTYSDFEAIVVNDGSPDNSQVVIDQYAKKYPDKIKSYIKKNGGLSDARNFGIEHASGDYLLFIDSDDYISTELLQKLFEALNTNEVDVLRFAAQTVFENGKTGEILLSPVLNNISGNVAIEKLIDNKQSFEPAWLYAYKKDFWEQNSFSYAKGTYHEDFGLTPEIILKANSFTAIDFVGYFYVQTPTSIIRNCDYSKTVKKANDIFSHVVHLKNIAENKIETKIIRDKVFSYLANAAINQIKNLDRNDKKDYISKLKHEDIFKMLLNDSLKRKLKNIFIKLKYGVI